MNRRIFRRSQQTLATALAIGDVCLMEFDGVGNEQQGVRPGVVFQNNTGNGYSPNIIALPITSSLKRADQPTHVVLTACSENGLSRDSMVLCENPQRMSKWRVIKKMGRVDDDAMRRIAIASMLASSAIGFLSYSELVNTWELAKKLNSFPS